MEFTNGIQCTENKLFIYVRWSIFLLNHGYIINQLHYERFLFIGGINRQVNVCRNGWLDYYLNEEINHQGWGCTRSSV